MRRKFVTGSTAALLLMATAGALSTLRRTVALIALVGAYRLGVGCQEGVGRLAD